MAKKIAPTNAARFAKQRGITFTLHEYDISDGLIDALSIATKCQVSPEIVYKTLVTRTHTGEICVFVISATHELNLKKAAAAAGVKNLAMIHVNELLNLTGYVRGGCSPIGMKHEYRTFLDAHAMTHPLIGVSAGRKGLFMQLSPAELVQITQATVADLVTSDTPSVKL